MSTPENEPSLALGMDFDEALRRFAETDPEEIKGDKRLENKRKDKSSKKT